MRMMMVDEEKGDSSTCHRTFAVRSPGGVDGNSALPSCNDVGVGSAMTPSRVVWAGRGFGSDNCCHLPRHRRSHPRTFSCRGVPNVATRRCRHRSPVIPHHGNKGREPKNHRAPTTTTTATTTPYSHHERCLGLYGGNHRPIVARAITMILAVSTLFATTTPFHVVVAWSAIGYQSQLPPPRTTTTAATRSYQGRWSGIRVDRADGRHGFPQLFAKPSCLGLTASASDADADEIRPPAPTADGTVAPGMSKGAINGTARESVGTDKKEQSTPKRNNAVVKDHSQETISEPVVVVTAATTQTLPFSPALPIGPSRTPATPARAERPENPSRVYNSNRANPVNNSVRRNGSDGRGTGVSQRSRPSHNNNNNNSNNNHSTTSTTNPKHATLNRAIVQCNDADAVLTLLQNTPGALTRVAGDGALNTVNFSTSIHRLARHANFVPRNQNQQQQAHTNTNNNNNNNNINSRAQTLADPRFALLLAGLAEALALPNGNANHQDNAILAAASSDSTSLVTFPFGAREWANIAWAIVKLKLVPPASALPLIQAQANEGDGDEEDARRVANTQLLENASCVRRLVMDAAKARVNGGDSTSSSAQWIPVSSQLAGYIVDHIRLSIADVERRRLAAVDDETIRDEDKNYLQEYSNMLWAWATADRVDPATFGLIGRSLIRSQRRQQQQGAPLQAQEWSNSLWAFATAQVYDGHEDLLSFVAECLTNCPTFADRFKPQELSNTIWAVATLLSNKVTPLTENEIRSALVICRHFARSVIPRVTELRSQELSNTLWAFATLGFGLDASYESTLNKYVVLPSDDRSGDLTLRRQLVTAFTTASVNIIERFRSQELNNLAWALARLVEEKTEDVDFLLERIGAQLGDRRRSVTTQDIGTTMWSMATLQYYDESVYRGLAARLTPSYAASARPQELSNIVYAIANAELNVKEADFFDTTVVPESRRTIPSDPLTIAFGIAAHQLMRRPDDFKPQELKDVLYSFSKAGIRHPELFFAMAEHLIGREGDTNNNGRGVSDFSPQGLGNLSWSYARQAQLVTDAVARMGDAAMVSFGNGRLAVYTGCFFDIGEFNIKKLFATIAETNLRKHQNLAMLTPQDLANTAWSYAVLGLRHTDFLVAVKDQLISRIQAFTRGERTMMTTWKGQEISNALWALATLNVPVGNLVDSVDAYAAAVCADASGDITVSSIARFFKRQELANIAWACAVYGAFPPTLIRVVYTGLLGDGIDPADASRVYKDGGLQSQAITTLIYLQVALDQEGSGYDVSLPANFPNGWGEPQGSRKLHRGLTETDDDYYGLVDVNPSKIQRAVSAAANRIGFRHVEEHTITMADLASNHGVKCPAIPLPILSIDLASLDSRASIEVDGPAHYISGIDGKLSTELTGHTKMINGKYEYQFMWKGDPKNVNGSTALKQRLLSHLGWKMFNLPFWEWYSLHGDQKAEDDYCRKIIDSLVGGLPSEL